MKEWQEYAIMGAFLALVGWFLNRLSKPEPMWLEKKAAQLRSR